MNDYVVVALILSSVGFMLVGWIWSMFVASKVSAGWLAGMAFLFIVALPVFAIKHWDKAKKPFIVSIIGFLLTYGLFLFLPEK